MVKSLCAAAPVNMRVRPRHRGALKEATQSDTIATVTALLTQHLRLRRVKTTDFHQDHIFEPVSEAYDIVVLHFGIT